MKKIISIISIILLTLFFINSVCMATDIDMNLDETNLEEADTNSVETTVTPTTTSSTTVTSAPTYTTVSGSSNSLNDGLTLTNIINIFVVVVGIVLILLGLAILVRLKY